MSDEINYKKSPLHGLSLKKLLVDMVDHYGFEILFAYLNINCFKTNPSIESSIKFLKKTDWAREKVEAFYLYQFKSLPRASEEEFQLSPRDRLIPEDQTPGEPAELSLEDGERLRDKRAKKAEEHGHGAGHRSGAYKRFGAQEKDTSRPRSNSRDNNRGIIRDDSDSRKVDRGSSNTSSEPASSEPASGAVDPWANWKNKSKD